MAVLNLETGEVEKEQPDLPVVQPQTQGQAPQPIQPQQALPQPGVTGGRVIDLETGGFIEPGQPVTPQPQVEEVPRGIPGAGIVEPLAAVATGAIAQPVSGLIGLGALPFQGLRGSAETIEAVQEALTFQPRTQRGREALQSLGNLVQTGVDVVNFPVSGLAGLVELVSGQGPEQAAQTVKEIQERGLTETVGERVLEETGSPVAATIAQTIPAAGAELVGLRGVRAARQAAPREVVTRRLNQEEELAARAAREASEETGIGLFKAQQTLNPTDIERQAFVAQLPEGSLRARDRLLTQNRQSFDAVNQFLADLAPPESITNAAPRFRDAAQKSIEVQKQIRRQKTSPIFNQAFNQQADVNLTPVRQFIDDELADLPEGGQIAKSLSKVKGFLRGPEKIIQGESVRQPPTLRQLHNAKLEIDQMLDTFGPDSLGNTTKRKLADTKDLLVTEMRKASPLYEQALRDFAEASPPVNALNDSIIGRIAGFEDTQLKNVARNVFDPAETNPEVIRNARRAIESVDPDAWTAITRAELERRLGNVRAELGDLASPTAQENIPGQLFTQLFGNKKKRDVLFNAVNQEQRQNLAYLERALRRATVGRPGGSQTAIRAEIRKELQGGVVPAIREFFRSPIQTITGVGEEAGFNQRTRALADALFDPSWSEEIAVIRELPSSSPEAQRRMQILLNSALIAAPAVTEQLTQEAEQNQQ